MPPILCLRIGRKPDAFVIGVTLPMFIVVLLSLAALLLDGNSDDVRFNAAMTTLLTTTAFRASVQSHLPQMSYLCLSDAYFGMAYFFHALIIGKIVLVVQLRGEGVGFFSGWDRDLVVPVGDLPNATRTAPGAGYATVRAVDDTTTWVLIAVWFLLHVMLLLDLRYPSIVTRHFKVSWQSLITRLDENSKAGKRGTKLRGEVLFHPDRTPPAKSEPEANSNSSAANDRERENALAV